MRTVEISLHNHTVLSPCAGLEMTPKKIMARAAAQGIEIIGITDHNSAANLRSAEYQAEKAGLCLLPGIELTSAEDIHLLAFFREVGAAERVSELIGHKLYRKEFDPERVGYQIIVDQKDEFSGVIDYYLPAALSLGIKEISMLVTEAGGVIIPAHVFRSQGLLRTLGFIPERANFKVLEYTLEQKLIDLKSEYKLTGDLSFIKSSDSHFLDSIKKVARIELPENYTREDILEALVLDRSV
ncbi:MAG: PHP domain-containing protein [Halarsenatibacteraceae bacterium]